MCPPPTESRVCAQTPAAVSGKISASLSRIAIVGHRALGSASVEAFVARSSRMVLEEARGRWERVDAVSALAEGADTLFAEAALELGLSLHVVTPFAQYESDFAESRARQRHAALRAQAVTETRLPFYARSEGAYEAAMRWVVDTCDLLVAAWDGRPSVGRGGTGDAVSHALATGRPVVHLDVAGQAVRTYGSSP